MMTDKIQVLYVDDEPDLLEIGKIFLEESGDLVVTTVDSVPAALELLQLDKFDAIVSDYQMPDMDGIMFIRELKASGNTTPFIIFTGKGREEVVIEALNEGVDFYLQKGGDPIAQFMELVHKIRSAVSHQRTEKQAKATERRLYDIINFLPDATFAIDTEENVIAWNLAIEEMTGVPARDMLGKGNYEYSIPFYGERRPILIDLVSLPDEELFRGRYAIFKREGDILIAETTLPRPRGRYSVLKGKASILDNDEGVVVGAIESIRDITAQKQVEEELRKVHDEYVHLLEHMTDVYYRSDTEGRLILASRSWAKYLGYDDLSECIGRNIANAFYADPSERNRFLEEVYRNGSVSNYEITLKKKDGTLLPVTTSSYIYFDESGNVLGVEGIWRDISDRKRAEEALQHLTEFQKSVITNTLVWMSVLDQSGKILMWNAAAEEITGYHSDEVIGQNEIWKKIYPDNEYRKQVTNTITRIIRNKNYLENFETTVLSKQGIKKVISWNTRGISDATGNVSDYIAIAVDITDRNRAEETLVESEDRHRTTLQTTMEGFWTIGAGGKVTDVNETYCRMSGYTREELLKLRINDLDTVEDPASTVARTQRIITNGSEIFETRHRRKDGSVFDVKLSVTYLNADGGKFICFCHDITDRKRAEDALRLANKKLSILSGITRHDINNQLTVLMGYLELLEMKQPDSSFSDYFNKITSTAERIQAMIQFIKTYEGIGVNAPVWQNTRTLVDTSVHDTALGHVKMEQDFPAGSEVFADPLITKVFFNLMDNAVRYGGKTTTIRFYVEDCDGDEVIVCEDDGDGIPAAEKEKIFERGFGKNTGLGLFLSREILSITGITIKETGDPGKGVRFEMAMPKGVYRLNTDTAKTPGTEPWKTL